MMSWFPLPKDSTFMPADARSTAGSPRCVAVHTRGAVDTAAVHMAQDRVSNVLARFATPADGIRVRLAASACGTGPALIQVNFRLCGAPARIQVPGHGIGQALEAGAGRLARQLHRLTRAWEPHPWPDPQRRVLAAPFEGRIARVKQVHLRSATPGQAIAAMDAMDYDVHLFTDADTGEEAIVYRAGPSGVRLARQHTMRPASTPATFELTVNPRKVPTLTADHAAQRLAEAWLPFVFYTDLPTRRGHLLYRRYDGDLTLICPIDGGTR